MDDRRADDDVEQDEANRSKRGLLLDEQRQTNDDAALRDQSPPGVLAHFGGCVTEAGTQLRAA